MDEELISEKLNQSDILEMLNVSKPDHTNMSFLESFKNSLNEPIPDLQEIVCPNSDLANVVEKIKELVNADGDVNYSSTSRKRVYDAFCYIAFKISQNSGNAKHGNDWELKKKSDENRKFVKIIKILDEKVNKLQNEKEKTESENGQLKHQLKNLEAQYTKVINENVDLKSKQENKENSVRELKKTLLEKKQYEKENNEMKEKINVLTKNYNTLQEKNKNQQANEQNHQEALDQLSQQYQKQSNEIICYRNTIAKLNEIICQILNQVFGKFEKITKDFQNNKSIIEQQNKNIEKLKNKIKIIENENKILKSPEFDKFLKIKNSFTEKFGDCDIITFISSNMEMKEKNDRLQTFINNLLRFLVKLVNSGELEFLLISPKSEFKEQKSEDNFKNQILNLIARCKQFLSENNILSNETDVSTINKLYSKGNQDNDELFNALSFKIITCGIYQKLYEQKNSIYKIMQSTLTKVSDFVNCNDEKSIHINIINKLGELKKLAYDLVDVIDDKNYNPNNIDSIISHIKDMKTNILLFKGTEKKIRNMTKFYGDIKGLPGSILKYNNEIKKKYDDALSSQYKKFGIIFSQIKDELIKEKEKSDKYIEKLSNTIQSKNDEIEILKNEVSTLSSKSTKILNDKDQKFNEEFNKLKHDYIILQENNNTLNDENENLKKSSEKMKAKFEYRHGQIIKQERENHTKEIQDINERNKKIEQQYKEEINKQNLRYSKLKNKTIKMLNYYENIINKQKKETNYITEQNNKLNKKLQDKNEKLNQFKNKLELLNSENHDLASKLEQDSKNNERNISIRDSYWNDKISLNETSLKKKYESKIEELNNKYLSFVEKLCESIQNTSINKKSNEDDIIKAIKEAIQIKQNTNKVIITEASYNKVFQALQAWDRWARDLFLNVCDGEVTSKSAKTLRNKLGTMVISSINQKLIIFKLESLRFQKKFLLAKYPLIKKETISFRSLIIISTGLIRIMRKSGHYSELSIDV